MRCMFRIFLITFAFFLHVIAYKNDESSESWSSTDIAAVRVAGTVGAVAGAVALPVILTSVGLASTGPVAGGLFATF